MDLKTELETIKRKNNIAIQSKAKLEGQLENYNIQMKEHGFNTTEEVKAEVLKLDVSIAEEQATLEKELTELNEYLTN